MVSLRRCSLWLACLVLACHAVPGRADPLRLVPEQADLVLKVEQPRKLLEAFTALDAFRQVMQLDALREFYDSTNARRFYQLLNHFEDKLGAEYPELLDRLAGNGAALALRFDNDKPPVLLVIESKDEKLLRQFVDLALAVLQEELARQDVKEPFKKRSYRGIDGVSLGQDLYLSVVGSTLLVANDEQAIKAALDLHLNAPDQPRPGHPALTDRQKLLPKDALAWLWLSLDRAREFPQFNVGFDTFTTEPATALFVGGIGDVARRSPSFCLGLSQQDDGFCLDLRFPRGKDGMGEAARLVLPDGPAHALPLLEPKHVQISLSYFLDLDKAWRNREKLLNQEALKGLQDLEKISAVFLGGTKLGKLLEQTGPHQRFVFAHQDHSTIYQIRPKERLGAFALVQDMRDPEAAKSLEFTLRSAALLASFQYNLKMVEEDLDGVKLVTYRFPEKGKFEGDNDNYRFNFTPCFALVGNQFFVSSTVELGRELIGLLRNESKETVPTTAQLRFYSAGLAATLRATKDEIITQAVLQQALDTETARRQTEDVIRLVEQLGTLHLRTTYNDHDTGLSLRLLLGRQNQK